MCAINSEDVEIKCHSFLSVFIEGFSYGRNATKGKELCDGEKKRDSKAPAMNCFNETFEMEVVVELENICHGEYQCTYNIPTVPLDPICDGMKREARVEFSCGKFWIFNYPIPSGSTHTTRWYKGPSGSFLDGIEECFFNLKV